MGELTWPIALAGTVEADLDAVVKWWCHPDRRAEYLDLVGSRGALDVTHTFSEEDGERVGHLRYRTARGWEFSHRLESNVGRDGMPARVGDRYVLETRDLETARSGRQHFEVRCVAVHEFVAMGLRQTQVSARHDHTMTGGRWSWRRNRRRRDYGRHLEAFTRRIEQCQKALGPSIAPPGEDGSGGATTEV